jgi:tetratricopeptide (TPR) repeat protein
MTEAATDLAAEQLGARQAAGAMQAGLLSALKVIEKDQRSEAGWLQLARTLAGLGQPAHAVAAYARTLEIAPGDAQATAGLGEMLLVLGRETAAEACFRRALAADETVAAAHYGLGSVFAQRAEFKPAQGWFERAKELDPKRAEAHFAVAFCLARQGQHGLAIGEYTEAVRLRPGFGSAWLNMGVSLVADGRDQLAEQCYAQAVTADPGMVSAHLNLGNLERSRKQFAKARERYDRALVLDGKNSDVLTALGYWHLEQGQFDEAREWLELARMAGPRNAEVANAKGVLLLAESETGGDCGKVEEAIGEFAQAEAMGHRTAASNRGNALLRQGRVVEAIVAHEAAVERDPYHPGARYNLALTQLRTGNFAQGWANYEVRWQFREVHPRPRRFAQARWNGEAARAGGRPIVLLIYAEQGLGDTLQFLRYLPMVAERGFRIVLEVQKPLVRLLRPWMGKIGGRLAVYGEVLPKFDLHCPLMSLPAVFGTTVATVPAAIPYLTADAAMAEPRAVELGADEPWCSRQQAEDGPVAGRRELRVGLAWAGNPSYRADRERSARLETFLPLLELENVRWVSLQKGESAGQIAEVGPGVRIYDGCSRDEDFADTAALVAGLDLVVTTDTAVAHLAGAMGKPLWLLLPWQSDWRWMQKRETTPWYPQARLFRQRAAGEWGELVGRVKAELEASG